MNLFYTFTYWHQYDSYGGYIRRALKGGKYYLGKTPSNTWSLFHLSSYHIFTSLDEAKLNADKIINNDNIRLLNEEESKKYLILL